MSINLCLEATIESTLSNGKSCTLVAAFFLWQTPTAETFMILDSHDIKGAYLDWAKQFEYIDRINYYAPDDFLEQGEIIKYELINTYEEHKKGLEQWFEEHKDWTISWFYK